MGMASGKLPPFVNHMDSGTVNLDGGTSLWVDLTTVIEPKVIIVYSNAFDLTSAKADKPVLGALAAWYIASDELQPADSSGWIPIVNASGYAVNWGSGPNQSFITNRSSYTEQRGVRLLDLTLHRFYLQGFGTGDYDFKYNTDYHWIAWD